MIFITFALFTDTDRSASSYVFVREAAHRVLSIAYVLVKWADDKL